MNRELTDIERQNVTLYRFVKPNSPTTAIVILEPGQKRSYLDEGDDPTISGLMRQATVSEIDSEIAVRAKLYLRSTVHQAEHERMMELMETLFELVENSPVADLALRELRTRFEQLRYEAKQETVEDE